MKTLLITLGLLFSIFPQIASQPDLDESSAIFIHRLKKSTNSGNTYEVYFNKAYIGKFKGMNKAFTSNYKEDWIVTTKKTGDFFLRIVEKRGEEIGKITVSPKKGEFIFIEFDPSAAYGYSCLKILPKEEGYQQVIDANHRRMQILDSDLENVSSYINMSSLLELQKQQKEEEVYAAKKEPAEKEKKVSNKKQPDTKKDDSDLDKNVQEKEIVSDIDINIPKTDKQFKHRYALIIGNEDYRSYQPNLSSEVNVKFAHRDAISFKKYAINALGIPEQNIIFELDADAVTMNRAINKLNLIIKNTSGKADVFVYYAGHGLPHEVTKEPYLIPVNVTGSDLDFAIKLSTLFEKLNEYESKKVTVFIDACFSGGARDQGLVQARGVKIKPNKTQLDGKIISFTASSGSQSSLPYQEQGHGLFTYYLLKYFQETDGEPTYGDLSKYLQEKIGINSVLINDKEQNPQTNISHSLQDEWKRFKFR